MTHVQAFDFPSLSARAAGDEKLKANISNAVMRQYLARQQSLRELPDSDRLRDLAARIRQHTLDHLNFYLDQTKASVQRNGGHVHFAADAQQARQIILDIAAKAGCRRCIKSKSMTSEEIELNPTLEQAGLEVVETDLGEFIAQIGHQKPSHLVGPIIHMDKADIARLFRDYFRTPYNDDAEALTRQARLHLREKFRRADLGITGGNFVVAESGQVCVVENEGNARYCTTMPRVLVSLVGMEKIVPRLADLAVMLKLLGRSSTGQTMTVYTNLFGGPRKAGEKDGPEEFHLVLLDNGRQRILDGQYRETLRCIRCGACLNACPVYRSIGGQAYGSVYSGPIGSVITPLLQSLEMFRDLPNASSLCGACYEVCPVKINIPQHLIHLRRDIVAAKISSPIERMIYRLWAWTMNSRWRYGVVCAILKFVLRRRARQTGWIERLPSLAAGWTQIRPMPAPSKKTFHQLWRKRWR